MVVGATAVSLIGMTLAACGDTTGPSAADPRAEVSNVTVVAQGVAFDTDEIEVTAGATLELEFTNEDAVPHNVAVYETEAATGPLFVGEIITGPSRTTTYEFDAPPEPGTYFFRCDIHPTTMVGDFKTTS